MKIPTIEEMTKDVAEKALQNLEVNDMQFSEFIVKIDKVADFLKSEIRICEERLNENELLNQFYDGVFVGVGATKKLTQNHILFCKKLLEMMNFEE